MYIGHYAVAAALVAAVPEVSTLPVAVGVAWPDLVWPALVVAGVERVSVDRSSPLQGRIRFTSYPWSHSLVLSNLLALVPAALVGMLYQSAAAGILFWLAAVSHWLLDAVVHVKDLPVLGWGAGDRRAGLGLWLRPRLAFVLEYLFFAAAILLVAPPSLYPGVLLGGLALHLANSNAFFGFTRRNPLRTPTAYAVVVLVGYLAAVAWFVMAWRP